MVHQRKMPSKVGIQAEHVKSEKHLANLKPSYSQNQDGKNRGADMKKKMKKSKSIKLSHLEALQSSPSPPSRRSFSQPGKPPPLHVPTASASPLKQQPVFRATTSAADGTSPNYMKPTSSSHAKKELFPLNQRNSHNSQSGSDNSKSLPRKFSSDSKAACVKKPAKTLTRSSSLSLVRTLTKTTSFKASRKSNKTSLCSDINTAPHRATCSSTLKDSKFPAYLILNPGGTESEGTSAMRVCPYTYCSLNGHHHADLPPLKSFMSARRRLLKRSKLEALKASRGLKAPLETEKEAENSVFEQSDSVAKPSCDEIGMDIFIEIYANEKDAKPKLIEDQKDAKSTIEDVTVMEVSIPRVIDVPSAPKSEIDLDEDLEKSLFDDSAIEGNTAATTTTTTTTTTIGSLVQEENADEDHQHVVWFHEEISMGSYCSDEEQHMDDSDSKSYDIQWEEEEEGAFRFDCKEEDDSSVYTEEDNDSKVESSSETSHDVSVTWLDDILSTYCEDFLVDEKTHKEANSEESTHFEEQPHGIGSVPEDSIGSTETQEIGYPFSDEIFEYVTNAEDIGGENRSIQCQKKSETCKNDENSKDGYSSSIENSDESNQREEEIHLFDVFEESNMTVQDQALMEKDQGKDKKYQRKSCMGSEEENTSNNWKVAIRRKRGVEDEDEMRKFNPKEPNFLPLVPEPEAEKVDLRHQMMDERKNAEEWMLDSALRQAVTKLAPARKKKVALLVEAFETVMPVTKCETHVRNSSAFSQTGRIQACS